MGSVTRLEVISLCMGLAACGKSVRTVHDSTDSRDAATEDAREPDPNDPCVMRAPIHEPALNCAYPIALVTAPPSLASVATLGQPDCRYRLGEPTELPWGHEAFSPVVASVYQFSFDVNGDQVGDIFFWDAAYDGIRLALSAVADGVLEYHVVDCDALRQIPVGRVFVRDLNGDSVPDLVVGASSYDTLAESPDSLDAPADLGIKAFVNLPWGFLEVARHEWPEASGMTVVLDVAVADFDGNGACFQDIAFGYDRLIYGPSEIDGEVGAAVLSAFGNWPSIEYNESRWASFWGLFDGFIGDSEAWTTGEIAAGAAPVMPPLFFAENPMNRPEGAPISGLLVSSTGTDFVEQRIAVERPDNYDVGPFDAWMIPFAGVPDVLVLHFGRDLLFYDATDPTVTPLPVLLRLPAEGMHGRNNALGGGNASATRFMIDVDGDGDLDFFERASCCAEGQTAAIHPNLGATGFGDPATFQVLNPSLRAESPFVAVGAAKGALIVNEGRADSPPSIQALECAPE